MAYGTLPNIANAGHEPTPDERAEQITRNLLKLPRSHFTVVDGTCGEGNLLAPFQGNAYAELIGIEINGKWADLAAARLPQAQIITAAVEHVSIAPNSISLAVLNPPYLVTNGGRMELQVFRQLCDAVQPHGVIGCIIPARSAWDRRFISAWKFPSTGDIEDKAGFERYSQIVVIGYKRPQQLAEAERAACGDHPDQHLPRCRKECATSIEERCEHADARQSEPAQDNALRDALGAARP